MNTLPSSPIGASGPQGPNPAGDVRSRWDWTEAAVWTDRMLTALEQGVKGGKWHALMDKLYRPETLQLAFARVRANRGAAGVDHETIAQFELELEAHLTRLSQELRAGTYRPQNLRRKWVPKGEGDKRRPLAVPTVRDRVVQTALTLVLQPIFEREFAPSSFGYRPGRSTHDALLRVDEELAQGRLWVVDADVQSFFDTLPHDRLLDRVKDKVSDGAILKVVHQFLKQGVLDGVELIEPESGSAQGSALSPLLANLYLDPLDHKLAELGQRMVRYADDFVVLCATQAEAQQALACIQQWVKSAGLTLHPEKTRIVNARHEPFEFLGHRYLPLPPKPPQPGSHKPAREWKLIKVPRAKATRNLKVKLRPILRRLNGNSLKEIIRRVNQVVHGWGNFFRGCAETGLRPIDGWIRMRLRSILRLRAGRHGRGRGKDHQRWPNSFFQAEGLWTLIADNRPRVSPING